MAAKQLTSFKLFLEAASSVKITIILTLVFLIVVIACNLAMPLIIRNYIEEVMKGGATNKLQYYVWIYILIATVIFGANLVSSYFSADIGWKIADNLRMKILRHIALNQPVLMIEHLVPGELLEKIDGNADIIGTAVSASLFNYFANILLIIGTIAVLSTVIAELSLVMGVFVILLAVLLVRLSRFSYKKWIRARSEKEHMFGFIGETIKASEDLRVLNRSYWPGVKLKEQLLRLLKIERTAYVSGRIFWPVVQLFYAIIFGVGFGFGLYSLEQNSISIGALTMVYLYIDKLQDPIEELSADVDLL